MLHVKQEKRMMKKINDEKIEAEKALIAGLKKRDESAFQVLHDTYSRRIYMTAYRILRDEELARDAMQESLINVYRAIKTFRERVNSQPGSVG